MSEKRQQIARSTEQISAATVFDDPLSTIFPDQDHSEIEQRFLINRAINPPTHIGDRTYRSSDTIRIITPGRLPGANKIFMKKSKPNNGMRPEYDFVAIRGGVRGEVCEPLSRGTNIVLLEPDIAEAFPNDKAANQALRGILNTTRDTRAGKLENKSVRPSSQRRPRSRRG